MSAGCMRWMLSRTVRTVCATSHGCWTPGLTLAASKRPNILAPSRRWSLFSTAADDTEQTPKKKKKQTPGARDTIGSVGRKIPQREIQVISETGENLGTMHRADVIRRMDEQSLKLVLLNDCTDPAVYRLMSGKQIHEEQMKLREKQKEKAAPVQVKELTFSPSIAAHDLSTKLKHVERWLEKKNHVRITLRSGRKGHTVDLAATLEQMVQQLEVMVGFVSKPKVTREGQAAMCVLRPPSAKELQREKEKAAALQSDDTESKPQSTDTTDGLIQ